MKRRRALWVVAAASAPLLCQCDANDSRATQPPPAAAAAEPQRLLVVFAAASLREVFSALGAAFEAARPGSSVTFHFAGSQALRTQIEHGAEADVVASADLQQLQALQDRQLVANAAIFARNQLVLAVSHESSLEIRALADLPRAARIVVGAPEVPVGRYTAQLFDRAELALGAKFRSEVEARVVSRELSVRQVLSKVSLGEADVGVVYRSDLMGARERATELQIPAELNVIAEYAIARVQASARPELARDFIGLVLSEFGQSALRQAGFDGAPSSRETP